MTGNNPAACARRTPGAAGPGSAPPPLPTAGTTEGHRAARTARPTLATVIALAATLLAACADDLMMLPGIKQRDNRTDTAEAAPGAPDVAASLPAPTLALPPPQPGTGIDRSVRVVTAGTDVPQIWLALEPGHTPGAPVGLVFAADGAGDGPGNDPAIRLTPAGGLCNPEELTSYPFRGPPVFDRRAAARGVGPAELPEFMAVSVSRAMIDAGLAANPEATRPQNVCTAKLWQTLVVGQNRSAG